MTLHNHSWVFSCDVMNVEVMVEVDVKRIAFVTCEI